MVDITANVGAKLANKVHDVSLVEAMLRIVKNAKGAPYLAADYQHNWRDATKTAIIAFQTDHAKAIGAGQKGKEPLGEVLTGAATIAALNAALPATHKPLRIIPNTHTVYLEGAQADATASATAIRTDTEFESTFKSLLAQLVDTMYAQHKIVLKITPTGRRRTFAQQAAEVKTKAGPGESNHNWGRASDIGFKGFQWIQGNGAIKKDADWLNSLEAVSGVKSTQLWDARDALAKALPLYNLRPYEIIHLQLYREKTFNIFNSLVALMNSVGKMKWSASPRYSADFGLGGQLYAVGTSKQIWSGNAPISKIDLAAALNAHAKAKKLAKIYKVADIDAKMVSTYQAALKADFQAADTNWLKWTKVT